MNIARGELLARLNDVAVGLSTREILEQSNCFSLRAGQLVTFNDEILARAESPLDFEAVVNATDLLTLLSRIPDDEIDVSLRNGEIRIKAGVKGKSRTAGISCMTEFHLPVDAVPKPSKWYRLEDGCVGALLQAARTCGQDETQYLTTVVHVTPSLVEASDNYRFLRVEGATGFPAEVLIPANSISKLEGMEVKKVSMGEGWVHFKTATNTEISCRCTHGKYNEKVDGVLVMNRPEKITLPANLPEMVERADVFLTAAYDAKVGVRIADGVLTLTSRKDGGWYKERKKIRYNGRPLDFDVNPKFLVEILTRTRDVLVDSNKMKIETGNIHFVVALTHRDTGKDEDEAETDVVEEPVEA